MNRSTADSQHVSSASLVRAHDRFSATIALDPTQVAEIATALGDPNPLHHDAEYAASTRYGRPIASGPHTTGLLLGATASHFSKIGPMVGLEFWVRFRRPIFADEVVRIDWLVVRVSPNARLRGDIVDLRGRIVGSDGLTAVGAKGKILLQAAH